MSTATSRPSGARSLQTFLHTRLIHHCSGPSAAVLPLCTMTKTLAVLLSLLAALILVAFSNGVQGAAVSTDQKDVKATEPQEHASRVFVSGSDASSFFKRRSRRSIKSQYELNVEQRQRLAADEQRREYREEQRNEYENYVEEVRDEQEERTREKTEQWREFHYDGLYRWYQYTRHHV